MGPRRVLAPNGRVLMQARDCSVVKYASKLNLPCTKLHFLEARTVMQHLNYKHLHYFWVIAKSGGVAKAGERLHVTPQSISTQMRLLEGAIGDKLWRRAGRKLELTDTGNLVLEYADRLFSVGEELKEALRGRHGALQAPFRVGVAQMVPKTLAHQLLAPALALPGAGRLSCQEGGFAEMLAHLAVHRLDLVLSDRPMHASMNVRGYNHLLLQCGVSMLAAPALARQLRKGFPHSLDQAPMLLQGADAAIRPRLMRWFDELKIQPQIVAEFDDTALMKSFGEAGSGVFTVPSVVAERVARQVHAQIVGQTEDVNEQIYGISSERRIRHPAVVAIDEAARGQH
jgi:LysR family transcriptional activator of nhaA